MEHRAMTAISVLSLCGAAASAGGPFGVERINLPPEFVSDTGAAQIVDSADIDGDGRTDYLIGVNSLFDEPLVGIAFGEPGGEFAFSGPVDLRPSVDAVLRSSFADIDGDGVPEIVTVGDTSWASIPVIGRDLGSPTVRQLVTIPDRDLTDPVRVGVGDFGGDSADAIAYFALSGGVAVLWPDGTSDTYDFGIARPVMLPASDYTGDGLADLAALDEADNRLVVIPGTGSRSFGSPQARSVINANGVVDDFDGDGLADYATVVSGSLYLYESFGSDPAASPRIIPAPGLQLVGVAAAVRLNAGEDPGAVVRVVRAAGSAGQEYVWWPGALRGELGVDTLGLPGAPRSGEPLFDAADLDGDGRGDLLALASAIDLYDARECGVPVDLGASREPAIRDVTFTDVVDLDGDGMDEIISVANARVTIESGGQGPQRDLQSIIVPGNGWMSGVVERDWRKVIVGTGSSGVVWVLSSNDGQWSVEQTITLPDPAEPRGLVISDLDLDGVEEIAVTDSIGEIRIFQFGAGGDLTEVSTTSGSASITIAAADLDGDGLPELLTGDQNTEAILVHRNLGGLSFQTETPLPLGEWAYWLVAADVDADGLTDLVTGYQTLQVLWGLPGGGFSEPQGVSSPGITLALTEIIAEDLDGDGDTDLAVASNVQFDAGRTAAYMQSEPRVFRMVPLPGVRHTTIRSGDVNGDGAIDLVSVGDRVRDISWGRGVACPPDLTGDCTLNIFDVQAFVTLYSAQNPAADLAEPFGSFDVFDVMAYIGLLNAGCP